MTACQEVLRGLETGKVSAGDVEEAKTKVQEVWKTFPLLMHACRPASGTSLTLSSPGWSGLRGMHISQQRLPCAGAGGLQAGAFSAL